MNWKGAAAKAAVSRGATRGLALAAEHVLEEANRTVPIEEGTLMRSGSTDAGELEASVFYTGPYAARQHEDMSLRHDAGRRAKWLEATMVEERDVVGRVIQREIRQEIR